MVEPLLQWLHRSLLKYGLLDAARLLEERSAAGDSLKSINAAVTASLTKEELDLVRSEIDPALRGAHEDYRREHPLEPDNP